MLVATELIEEKQVERVKLSKIPEIFGYVYRLQEIVYRAEAKLKLSIVRQKLTRPILISDGDEYLTLIDEQKKWQYIVLALDAGCFCPEPPGGVKKEEHKLSDSKKYFSIRSLWDLKHIMDSEDANEELYLKCREVYYLNDPELFWNRSYFDFSDGGTEFLMSEEVYYVEDIKRWIMVEACYDSY